MQGGDRRGGGAQPRWDQVLSFGALFVLAVATMPAWLLPAWAWLGWLAWLEHRRRVLLFGKDCA